MSRLRQRAIWVSVESIRSDRRPAEARAWFVIEMSCRSEVELNEPPDQAATGWGWARPIAEPSAKTRARRPAVGRRVIAIGDIDMRGTRAPGIVEVWSPPYASGGE